MDVHPDGWLEETLKSRLLLGNCWLQDKHEKKKLGNKGELDRVWEGIYHDNGSCLDIISYFHPEHNSALQIVQACHRDH
jgi:hypothetical protein